MAAYPREMPDHGASSISFEPQRVDYLSPETGGRIGAVAAGWPLWRMRLSLNNMAERDADIWRAWLANQRGGGRPFIAWDLARELPRLHRDGVPIGTAPTGWSQTIDSEGDAQLTLAGFVLPVMLTVGDYVGFKWDSAGAPEGSYGRRALVRVTKGATADAEGNMTVAIDPPVPTIVPPGAQAHLDRPACLMRLVTGSTQFGEQLVGGYTAQGGVIEAAQDLIA